jgi:hypothetical protein
LKFGYKGSGSIAKVLFLKRFLQIFPKILTAKKIKGQRQGEQPIQVIQIFKDS